MTDGAKCARCVYLEGEVAFWRDQQKFAASMVSTIADLDEVAPALRQLLRQEIERRKSAENEVARLSYRLAEARGALP